MEPTLHCARPGSGCQGAVSDRAVIQPLPASQIKRGDILLFTAPPAATDRCAAGVRFLKRAIALPGETWSEVRGYAYINGKRLSEPYVASSARDSESFPARQIAGGTYFMMGDNRVHSCDSRVWGSVPAVDIVGKVVKVIRRS
jgi:signal peptidase I